VSIGVEVFIRDPLWVDIFIIVPRDMWFLIGMQ